MRCHGAEFNTRAWKIKTTALSFSLMGIHLDPLQLFKAELGPKYVNRAHGTPVGSEPFLPSIVSCHDMAQSKPPTVFTPFNHTHRQVLSLGGRTVYHPSKQLTFLHECFKITISLNAQEKNVDATASPWLKCNPQKRICNNGSDLYCICFTIFW